MAPTLANLTKDGWSKLKKDAGIKSAGFFKKHDAAVGKAVASFQKARKKWAGTPGLQSSIDLFTAMSSLEKAFDKFLAAKEFKSDLAKNLQDDVKKWRNQLNVLRADLANVIKAKKDELAEDDSKRIFRNLGF